jgi:hypothetical protein
MQHCLVRRKSSRNRTVFHSDSKESEERSPSPSVVATPPPTPNPFAGMMPITQTPAFARGVEKAGGTRNGEAKGAAVDDEAKDERERRRASS